MPLIVDVVVNGKLFLLVHDAPPTLWSKIPSDATSEVGFAVWIRFMLDDLMPEGKTGTFGYALAEYYQEKLPL